MVPLAVVLICKSLRHKALDWGLLKLFKRVAFGFYQSFSSEFSR